MTLKRARGPQGDVVVLGHDSRILRGNQYVNSSAIGDYADYLTREIVPFVDREFRTLAGREHRGCFGKSSGRYDALRESRRRGIPDGKDDGHIRRFLETGASLPERWRARQRHDPVNLVARYRANLKSLRGIYIDCGWKDQYHIHYGARRLSARLSAARVRHTYEEFDDNHSDIDYRMDVSLPFLARALR